MVNSNYHGLYYDITTISVTFTTYLLMQLSVGKYWSGSLTLWAGPHQAGRSLVPLQPQHWALPGQRRHQHPARKRHPQSARPYRTSSAPSTTCSGWPFRRRLPARPGAGVQWPWHPHCRWWPWGHRQFGSRCCWWTRYSSWRRVCDNLCLHPCLHAIVYGNGFVGYILLLPVSPWGI